ncbi:MAG: helix-turn-helix domain-containing protein [Nostoc sp.]|uniref:helix-turn-helix domain-containing protein n=1 Tax=Nostoc sp. TaxID=1180 RepID=UPI002FF83824
MKKPNFQAWLQQKVSDEPEVILAGKLEYLRLYLTDAMREIRKKAGLTQAELAQKLGVKQAAVSKLESALKEHELESVLHYLHTLGADLLVAVKQGDDLYQASDNEGVLLVDVPDVVFQKALAANMSVREYVRVAVEKFSGEDDGLKKAVEAAQKVQDDIMKYGLEAAHLYCDDVDGDWLETWGEDEDGQQSFVELVTNFLQSDDLVAVRVRKQLKDKSLQETVVELERCLSLSEEDNRIFAVKNILVGGLAVAESNRGTSSDEIDETDLLDLAEELLEKLAEILSKHN